MTVCQLCNLEMRDGISCINIPVVTLSGHHSPTPFGSDGFGGERCGDCGVPRGGFHHRGCDIERCPRCGDQLITCGCDISEPDPDLFESDIDGDVGGPTGYAADRQWEESHTDVVASGSEARWLLGSLADLLPNDLDRRRVLRLASGVGPGTTVRFCFETGSRSELGLEPLVERVLPPRWQRLAEQVGGAAQLAALTTEPLPDEEADLSSVSPSVGGPASEALDYLDTWCAELGAPAELRTAGRRLLAELAALGGLRVDEPGASRRLAASVLWLAGRANELIGPSRWLTAKRLWQVCEVSPSLREHAVRLGGLLGPGQSVYQYIYGECEISLASPRYLTGNRRAHIKAKAAALGFDPTNGGAAALPTGLRQTVDA